VEVWREGGIAHTGKSKFLLLSDVSEEMYNRILWWLKGLCFPFLGGGGGVGGREGLGKGFGEG
jgi:hypothetical protein